MLLMQVTERSGPADKQAAWEVDYGARVCEAVADGLCRFNREDYKHLVHMQLMERCAKDPFG